MDVRVRYAPSPTGFQHVGGVRTALFNYFFARSTGGQFILRVEDTDRERSSPQALDDLFSTLKWLGLDYNEGPDKGGSYGPYVQSQRLEIYKEKAKELVDKDKAYLCFCSSQRLESLRKKQKEDKSDIGYDRLCRNISRNEAALRAAGGEAYVVRLKIPLEGKTEFNDVLFGRTGRKNKDINPDPVILKTDGFPTYHLANVIDDHMMKITHIMRAQEWIPSGPLHVLIYRAFGWTPPLYCHLPMVMGKDGQKLSKRHGSTAVREFKKMGYLPEALINFLSLLGWSYDDSREFFSKEEMCKFFDIKNIKKAPAVFNYKKLDWFNGQYIRMKDSTALRNQLLSILSENKIIAHPPTANEKNIFDGAFPIIQKRLKLLNDVSPMLHFLFSDPGLGNPDDAIPKNMDGPSTAKALQEGIDLLSSAPDTPDSSDEEACETWDSNREGEFRKKAEDMGWKIANMLQPMRMAITASKVSPPLFPAIRLLGVAKAIKRAERLRAELENFR